MCLLIARLDEETCESNDGDHDDVSSDGSTNAQCGNRSRYCIVYSTRGSCAVGKSAIDQDGAGTVDIGNLDKSVVEFGVVSIPDERIQEGCVAVIITTTDRVHGTETGNCLGLVHA